MIASIPQWDEVMLGNYGTPPLIIESGSGCVLTATDGRQYLDLLAGIAVSTLGHGHPAIVQAVSTQVSKLAHTSNLMAHEPGLKLAAKLLSLANFDGRVFFSQDGATANEAALKLARRWGYKQAADGSKLKVISMKNGFHGRTMGALAVTGNPAKREPFAPFGIDVDFVEFGNIGELEKALSDDVCAVILEPIQGEGGIVVPPTNYVKEVRELTKSRNVLMIVDEVQSGMGRSGEWFMSTAAGITPDIITFAKGIASGLPLGGMLVSTHIASAFASGDHGTTFGGNPVSCAAALAMIDVIESQDLVLHSKQKGEWLQDQVRSLGNSLIVDVRGQGLWIAIEFAEHIAGEIEQKLRAAGFLVNAVKPNAVRLAPPLIITQNELAQFVFALAQLLESESK